MLKNEIETAVQPHRKTAIEDAARQQADSADLRYPDEAMQVPDKLVGGTYWDQVVNAGERVVYIVAYNLRISRRLRKIN
jgi:hypothetical protein